MEKFDIGFSTHAIYRLEERGISMKKIEETIKKAGEHIYNLPTSDNVVIISGGIVVVCGFKAFNQSNSFMSLKRTGHRRDIQPKNKGKFVVVTAIADKITHLKDVRHLFVVS